MKNNIKIFNVICIILIAICLITSNAYAANDSFKTEMTVDNTTPTRGERITVAIEINSINIEGGEKGVGAYTAKIDYDTSVLEVEKAEGSGTWEAPTVEGNLMVSNTSDGKVVKSAQQIGTITFKIKDNAKLGDTTIRLSDFYGSNAESDVLAESSSVKITVVDNSGSGNESGSGSNDQTGNGQGNNDGNGSGTQSENGENQNGNLSGDNIENGTNNGGNSYIGEKNEQSPESLPKAGKSNIVIYLILGISLIIAISLLIKKKARKNKIRS